MSGLQCLYHCLAKLIADVLACLLRILEITPLEIASCCVLMVSSYDNAFLIALALLILALAALDWHVAVGHLIAMANLYIPRGQKIHASDPQPVCQRSAGRPASRAPEDRQCKLIALDLVWRWILDLALLCL